MMHRSGLEHLLKNIKRFWLLNLRLRFTELPEEIYLHTMLMVDSNKSLVIRADTHRYIDWEGGGRSPRTLHEKDLDLLRKMDYLFGRKFEIADV